MTPPASAPRRLAVVVSHPIQYYAPWFAALSRCEALSVRVFYLWDFGVRAQPDPGFGIPVLWDVPLLQGYEHEFVSNASRRPGTHRFFGLRNPQLVDRLVAWRPDVVLLFGYAWYSPLRLLFSHRLAAVPILLRGDSHDIGRAASRRQRLMRALRRVVFGRLRGALAVGQANAAYLEAHGVPPQRIFRAPHFVDAQRFGPWVRQDGTAARWRREHGLEPDDLVVLFAGKFEPVKRPLDLLEAWRQAYRPRTADGRRPVLVFVGGGALEAAMREQAARQADGAVRFIAFQNQRAMPAAYGAADLLVLPSASETWGLCVNEAMRCGAAAIVSANVGCGPDLIEPGRTGWIFPAGDVAALAAVLREALSDPARLRRMGEAALERAGGYSMEAATAGLLAAMDAVCGERATS